MVQHELHGKTPSNQHLNHGPPLQNPLSKHGINKVVLNIVHHTSHQLQEMLPHRMAEKKPSHEVSTAAIDCLQMGKALIGNPEAMEINIRRPSTPEVYRIKIVDLRLVKASEESRNLACGIGNCSRAAAYLKLRRCNHTNKNWT